MAHTKNSRREIEALVRGYGLVPADPPITAKRHLRWMHPATGRIVFTICAVSDPRSLMNTERSVKKFLRDIGGTNA